MNITMKLFQKPFLILITFFLGWTGVAKSQEQTYVIEGIVDNSYNPDVKGGLKDGSMIFLKHDYTDRVDTTYVQNGRFRFSGSVPFPSPATISYFAGGRLLLLDESEYLVTFKLESEDGSLYGYQSDAITGSPYHNLTVSLYDRSDALKNMREELMTSIQHLGSDDMHRLELEAVNHELNTMFHILLDSELHPAQVAFLVVSDVYFSYDRYVDFYDSLPEDVKYSGIGERLKSKLKWSQQPELVQVSGQLITHTVGLPAEVYFSPGRSQLLIKAVVDKAGYFSLDIPAAGYMDSLLFAHVHIPTPESTGVYYERSGLPPGTQLFSFVMDTAFISLKIKVDDGHMDVEGGRENLIKAQFDGVVAQFADRIKDPEADLKMLREEKIKNELALIRQHPESQYSVAMLQSYFRVAVLPFNREVASAIASLDRDAIGAGKVDRLASAYAAYVKANVAVKDELPSLANTSLVVSEGDMDYATLMAKYDYVLFDLWAPWCGPCIRDHKKLKEIVHHFGPDAKVGFAGLAIQCSEESWSGHVERNPFPYPQYWLDWGKDRHLFSELNVFGIPRYLLIRTADGQVMEDEMLFNKMEAKLGSYM